MKTVQRRTGISLWRQVADQIRQSVLTGLAANERLPAEAELATRFGVNRHTVPLHVSTALSLPDHTQVIELSTVSAADGVPVSAATSWFDAARFGQIAELYAETGSITASLARLGVDDYTRKTTAIEARHASSEDLDLLALSPGAIVLLTRAIDIDSQGQPVLYGESRFAADRVELLIDNSASGSNGDAI